MPWTFCAEVSSSFFTSAAALTAGGASALRLAGSVIGKSGGLGCSPGKRPSRPSVVQKRLKTRWNNPFSPAPSLSSPRNCGSVSPVGLPAGGAMATIVVEPAVADVGVGVGGVALFCVEAQPARKTIHAVYQTVALRQRCIAAYAARIIVTN